MRQLLTFAIAMSISSIFSHAQPLTPGTQAPDITAPDQDAKEVRFADVYSNGLTLVYFYPKADTPGCTAQACSLRDSFAGLQSEGVTILGVSGDSPEGQKKFREKYGIPFTLISDSKSEVAAVFGVPTTLGIPSRQSFIIKDGKIAWATPKARTKDAAVEVQEALNSLK